MASQGVSDESEWDSDTTFVPHRRGHNHSQSQPDLPTMRANLEGWVDTVARVNGTSPSSSTVAVRPGLSLPTSEPSRQLLPHAKTQSPQTSSNSSIGQVRPPSLPGPTANPQNFKTSPSVQTIRPSPPQIIQRPLTTGSPPTPTFNLSPDSSPSRYRPMGDMPSSEDADDDLESTSASSDSLSFSPRRAQLRRRMIPEVSRAKALGLSLGPDDPDLHTNLRRNASFRPFGVDPVELASLLESRLQQSSLYPLRMLAVVPSVWGICVLMQAFMTGGLWEEVWPWGVDWRLEMVERLLQGGPYEGTWLKVSRGDMVLAMAWAACTAHFCFCLTTGLTYRWRSYYSLLSTLTRLLSLQSICWPATYVTLWFLGPHRLLLCWVVIGISTGWSRCVQMWVTSNVIPPSPRAREGDMTPNSGTRSRNSPALRSISLRDHRGSPVMRPAGLRGWGAFTYGRKWDWDAVASEVGWKVGFLLLITTAWMFWGLETGRLVRV
ncbi:hypothetical protein TREMEDRAFT_66205 [Tremella mesenterica DSM 1558]|uniref:uncharacterized protein n=1 Tax=Tremella mesenterica (strain ATCC 24925 / CBS 8224 / DSM 1558 / NBRC 9311 / NRRL Y-6157 / RJB 2259-6 / UBC 559-6) TaxID=578456 RepID=UPI00032C5806|nr:uncharacterized protein TREMEDRAFT_66205 [Tremella mesenterica DSM 1558]EIW65837.1 hypothetical protein TREMEDRAFT_66205 [Tremella mesenterica DSM 1558]